MSLESILKEGLDLSPDCFGVINQYDVVVYCNHVFASMLGITKEEAIGQTNQELLKLVWQTKQGIRIEAEDFDQWYDSISQLQNKKNLNQFETDLTDGRWFKMTRTNLNNGYVILYGVNITDLKKSQKSLKKANLKVKALANTDQLTGVNNRRSFNMIAVQEINKAKRYQAPLSLLALDIDNFKQINDTYGHECGDDVLKELTKICKKQLRQADSLCRLGGDEFVILLPMTCIQGAFIIADRIRQHVENYSFYLYPLGKHIKLTTSIGLSGYQINEKTKDILARADLALYAAKKKGRNQVVVHSCHDLES